MKSIRRAVGMLAAVAMLWPATLRADVVELRNGDTLSGKVIAVDEKTVKIQNEVLGEVTLPREKVAALILGQRPRGRVSPRLEERPGLGDARPRVVPPKLEPQGEDRPADWWRKYGETPEEIVENLAPKDFGPGRVEDLERGAPRYGTPEEAVEQLRREGVPPGLKDQLQMLLPGFATPQVQDYFDKTVEGLSTGSITLDDLRKDAVEANEQIKELQEELGPSGKALDGYRAILENFIRRTQPTKSSETPSIPEP